jgi:hypothetical protein
MWQNDISNNNISNLIKHQYEKQQKIQNGNWSFNFMGSNWFSSDLSGNDTSSDSTTNKKTIVKPPPQPMAATMIYFEYIIMFVLFYFIAYFIISFFVSFERLVNIFNIVDFLFILVFICSIFAGIITNPGQFCMSILANLKPFFNDITYLIYLLFFILFFWFLLYLFQSNFSISKPIVLSLIEGILYGFVIIVVIIDVTQMAFNIPLISIMETEISGGISTPSPIITLGNSGETQTSVKPCTNQSFNINAIKDPNTLHSFYDSQVNAYKQMMTQFKSLHQSVNTSSSADNFPKTSFKDNFIYGGSGVGGGVGGGGGGSFPKTKMDNNINATLKYWTDNSSNIVRSVNSRNY